MQHDIIVWMQGTASVLAVKCPGNVQSNVPVDYSLGILPHIHNATFLSVSQC